MVAIGGYLLVHRTRHQAKATGSAAAGAATAAPQQPASRPETTPVRPQVVVYPIESFGQRPTSNLPKLGKADSPTGHEAQPARSQTDALVAPVPRASQAASDEGSRELILGRHLLGQGVPEDHAAAAQWLWKSVAKQNADAALLLSDLHARGDGVAKSCDQARILRTAAAKGGPAKVGANLDLTENAACR